MVRQGYFKSLAVFVVLALVFSVAGIGAAARPAEPLKFAELYGKYDFTSEEIVTIIVELDAVSMIEAKHTGVSQSLGKLKAERDRIIAVLGSFTDVQVNRDYSHVFSGMSLNLREDMIPALLAIPGVRAVYPNVEYTVTTEEMSFTEVPEMIYTAPYIGAERAWNELGFTGQGITVAVIDTGCDYTHPDLVHAFGDYKGWDFVDNDADPQETPPGIIPEGETAHGTHVSGTIAANGLIKGIAPEAKLLAYRVLGPGGSGYTTDVVAGIERAVLDGADVMNLSLGNTINDPDWATSIALDWAMAEGVMAVTSNGNSGPDNWTVGSPGTSRQAISVGATALPQDFFAPGIFTSEGVVYSSFEIMGYTDPADVMALDGNEYEFVYAGLGGVDDFAGLDLTGKVALIQRGTYTFLDKAANAAAAGAVAAIIFNNAAGDIGSTVGGMVIPTFKMSGLDGVAMYREMIAGNNKVTFTMDYLGCMESVADFSSRGPVVATWMIKPDVCAPGVDIISTVPTHNPAAPHGYAIYQGTSMSSPHVAGAAALLAEAHPDWSVDDIKAALMNTAVELTDPYTGVPYPHNTQGAGSIRVDKAIETKTLVAPGSYSFGVFDKAKGKQAERQSFAIKNLSAQRAQYSLDVQFPDGIKVNASKNLKVGPGKTQLVDLLVQVDASALAPGYYEGIIMLSAGEEEIRVPAILFVGEPDYPLLGGAGLADLGDQYLIELYLPGGADAVFLDLYTLDVQPVAELIEDYNVPAGYAEYYWDKTASGQPLPPGTYYMVAFIYKGDRAEGWILDEVVVP
ncbi:MAG: S8 family serine peptidase [Eubacteriales bacterium]|nr:S8 family serine peptidase [Eubacteriales bacterium]